jgi:murein tripeptide amidase MpaA
MKHGVGRRAATGVLGALLALLGAGDGVRAQSADYLNHNALTRELRALADGSDLARIRSIGQSHEGRDIWVVEIADRDGAPVESRPALLVVGNLEGNHLVGSALALETVRYLLDGEGEEVAAVLANQVVYVVPRLNPDGAEAMFAGVRWDRTRNARPFDDDNDGRTDEDPPEDLNGDGMITVMRVRDPFGDFMVHPDDARLMKRADATEGESGEFTVYIEGRDSDGDGFLNEDGPGGVDLNRNFQHEYPYWQRDAGPYMVSEPESRALMDFVIANRNIAAVLTFGHTDNLVTPPNARGELAGAAVLDLGAFAMESNADVFDTGVFRSGGGGRGFGGGFFFGGGGPRLRGAQPGRDNDPSSGRRPSTTVHRADLPYFEAVSEAYKEITGISKVGVNRQAEGAFFQYGYYQFGVPSFSTQGWGVPEPPAEAEGEGEEEARPTRGSRPMAGAGNGSSLDATLLSAMDAAGIQAFVDWTPFQHPDLGEVEIGGFMPYATTNPPADRLAELGRAHGEFAVRLAGMLPRVEIVTTEVTAHGGGIFTVTAEIQNTGYFPTSLQHGQVARAVDPTMVQIQVDPEDVLTGDDKSFTVSQLDGSGAREKVSWVIRGREGSSVEIRVRSQKGGSDTATVTLR